MDRAAKMLNVDKIFVEKSADGTTTVLVIVLASSIMTYELWPIHISVKPDVF